MAMLPNELLLLAIVALLLPLALAAAPARTWPTCSSSQPFHLFSWMPSRDAIGSNCASKANGNAVGMRVRSAMQTPVGSSAPAVATEIAVVDPVRL